MGAMRSRQAVDLAALPTLAAVWVATVMLLPASAAAADPAQGRLLANQWCTSCHVVEPGGPGVEVGPTFESVANNPEGSPDRLRGWLAAPHPPMPDLNLSRLEIESIAAYIESLKTAQ